jgi:hypothetical protein
VAESRQPLHAVSDESLGGALRDLAASVAFPSAGGDPGREDVAARVRARIEELGMRPSPAGRRRWFEFGFGMRPMRRGLVLALAALLVLAAVAGAVGLGLPGLRIIFGDVPSQRPVASPTASSPAPSPGGPLGSDLGLGTALPLAEVERLVGFDLILPSDPAMGPPDVAYLAGERAVLVWAGRPGLPATRVDDIGLLISEFQGHVETGYYEKVLGSGTKLTPVTVNGSRGYWIDGDPHFFYYVDSNDEFVDDTHREVGDTLIWSTGEVTYRLESGLDMDEAIRLAESLE